MLCEECKEKPACLVRPSDKSKLCKECFLSIFEANVHETIVKKEMFENKDRICIGVSGGKDSSVLAHLLVNIKKKYSYQWELFFLAIDEGIKGYRDDSLKVVYELEKKYKIPLKVLKFEDLFHYTMDQVVRQIGMKNNCTVCGIFRRKALELGATLFNCTKLVTGHNADDLAETILMNLCRGSIDKLAKNINIKERKFQEDEIIQTGCSGCNCDKEDSVYEHIINNKEISKQNESNNKNAFIPRLKPLMFSFEKEIVLYAFHLKLDYFSTECTYSPNSFRGNLRSFIKEIEIMNPQFILNIIHSSEFFYYQAKCEKKLNVCIRCSAYSSKSICKACLIIEGLSKDSDNSFLYSEKRQKKKNKKKLMIQMESNDT